MARTSFSAATLVVAIVLGSVGGLVAGTETAAAQGNSPGESVTSLYLKIEGIEGEVTDQGYERAMALLSYTITEVGGTIGSPTGAGAGQAGCPVLTVTKRTDRATPRLWLARQTGQHFQRGVLTVVERDGSSSVNVRFRIEFGEIHILRYELSMDDGGPLEEWRFDAGRWQLTVPYGQTAVTSGWDCRARRPL